MCAARLLKVGVGAAGKKVTPTDFVSAGILSTLRCSVFRPDPPPFGAEAYGGGQDPWQATSELMLAARR